MYRNEQTAVLNDPMDLIFQLFFYKEILTSGVFRFDFLKKKGDTAFYLGGLFDMLTVYVARI